MPPSTGIAVLLLLAARCATASLALFPPWLAYRPQHPLDQPSSGAPAFSDFTRVQQDDSLCEARGRQWTGKVPVLNRNSLFYWYFESLSSPHRAPTVMFLAGGPGEATATALLSGLGPCHIQEGNSTVFNPFTWTNHFNVIFLDEVAGSGFSKTSKGVPKMLSTIREVALDVHQFLRTFTTEIFPELGGREFHIIGESFGGFLAPAVAAVIFDGSAGGPRLDIDLKSIVMSSPLIDQGFSSASYYDVLCAQEERFLNTTECTEMQTAVPKCESIMQRCRDSGDEEICDAGAEACWNITKFWYPPQKNMVHLKKPCYSFPTCSRWAAHVERYMNDAAVQARLGLQDDGLIEFNHMDMTVNQGFTHAMAMSNWTQMTYLLDETPLRILIRSGELDPDTPRIGNERAADAFSWYGQAPFRACPHRDWFYTSSIDHTLVKGGFFKGYDKMWLVSLDQAGHMIESDDPEAGLHVLKQWVSGDLSLTR